MASGGWLAALLVFDNEARCSSLGVPTDLALVDGMNKYSDIFVVTFLNHK